MKFEAHATFAIADWMAVQRIGVQHDWKYSQIDGDALMGPKAFCYLTAYDSDCLMLHQRLEAVALEADAMGVKILRGKIEHIVYDTKTGVNELSALKGRLSD